MELLRDVEALGLLGRKARATSANFETIEREGDVLPRALAFPFFFASGSIHECTWSDP